MRNAHFFGGTPGPTREFLESGAFNASTVEDLVTNYSTGGATPVVFNATSSNQGTPFQLGVSNHVNAGENTALNFNLSPFGASNFVSLVQSRITESGIVIGGGSGTGYFVPTFRITGTWADSHSTAFGQLSACAGIPGCTATGLGNSTGGNQSVNVLFTPGMVPNTQFTFNTPFSFFFFVSAGVSSLQNGSLAPGEVSGNFVMTLESYQILDSNGDVVAGATIDSDIFAPVPEPGTFGLLGGALGLVATMVRARRR